MKIDSVNKFLFYSSPKLGGITKFDLVNQATGAIVEDYTGVMGIACDPSRGELYFADQGNLAIMIVDYAGTNFSTVHNLAPYEMIPYGMDVSPAATVSDFNLNDPGIIFFTGFDDYYGYIVQANLFGGKMEVVYTSTSKAVYGIVMDTTYEMLWWLEDRGVANGLYCSMFSGSDQSYVSYLQNSYWIAALWSLEMIYTCDYDEGVVYELDLDMQSGQIKDSTAIAYVDQPRIIGYYYNIDSDETLSAEDSLESEDPASDSADTTEDESVNSETADDSTTSTTSRKKNKSSKSSSSKTTTTSVQRTPSATDPSDLNDDSTGDSTNDMGADNSPSGPVPADAPEGSPGTPSLNPELNADESSREAGSSFSSVSAIVGSVVLVAGLLLVRNRASNSGYSDINGELEHSI